MPLSGVDIAGASIGEGFIVSVKDVLNTLLSLMMVECFLILKYGNVIAADFVQCGCSEINEFAA